MPLRFAAAAFATLLTANPVAALAQTTPAPVAAKASGATSLYRSAFDGYRAYADQPVLSWSEANGLVGRVGGWKAYAREAQAATPAADGQRKAADPATRTPPAAASAAPSSDAHHQHKPQ